MNWYLAVVLFGLTGQFLCAARAEATTSQEAPSASRIAAIFRPGPNGSVLRVSGWLLSAHKVAPGLVMEDMELGTTTDNKSWLHMNWLRLDGGSKRHSFPVSAVIPDIKEDLSSYYEEVGPSQRPLIADLKTGERFFTFPGETDVLATTCLPEGSRIAVAVLRRNAPAVEIAVIDCPKSTEEFRIPLEGYPAIRHLFWLSKSILAVYDTPRRGAAVYLINMEARRVVKKITESIVVDNGRVISFEILRHPDNDEIVVGLKTAVIMDFEQKDR